jgi:uncharacterized RDD family membrane protein YckC
MQCPKCGSLNPETRDHCGRCGAPLSIAAPTVALPDWRKEVTRKVKAYGDRKRTLTTPPGPIKGKAVAVDELPEPEPHAAREIPLRGVEKPPAVTEKPRPSTSLPPRRPVLPPRPEPPPHGHLEVWKDDVASNELEEEKIESVEPPELRGLKEASRKMMLEPDFETTRAGASYFWRRAAAFCIDMVVLTGSYAALLYAYTALIQDDVMQVIFNAWPAIIELFLLVHFLYYLYFYSTSRQTPGQVFFSIELRDAGGPDIPFHKILTRWLSMVILNLFNILPVLFGKNQLLMDVISGTEIRALK